MGTYLDGTIEDRFAAVGRCFERLLAAEGERGASVCVTHRGRVVVDLYGGVADPETGRRWEKDTICVAWSCVKGATAFCAHVLADRGMIDLDAPVATYWPEFGQAGKETISVRHVLTHQAGVAGLRETVPRAGFLDWERSVRQIALEAPLWEPGTRHGYHGFTFGFVIGEVIRRATGRPISRFFREEIAGPLGLDSWIGLPASEEERVVKTSLAPPPPPSEPPSSFVKALFDATSVAARVMNCGDMFDPEIYDSRAAHAAELPASGGITNARGLAGLYAPLACAGRHGATRLLSEESVAEMGRVSSAGTDACSQVPTRYALGFQKRMDNRRAAPPDRGALLIPEAAFGHLGVGGSLGFADPEAELSFAFVTNRGVRSALVDERAHSLIDAAYESLGHRATRAGWLPPR